MNEKKEEHAGQYETSHRRHWHSMKISYVGDVKQLILTGPGKLSIEGGDPGEPRKQQGSEP